MSSLFPIPVRESQTCRHSRTFGTVTPDTLPEQSSFSLSLVFQRRVRSSHEITLDAQVAVSQRGHRLFVRSGRTGQANPAVQLTATSHGLRHMISGRSITPSRLLLPHPARRRYAVVSVCHFSPVAVADFVR